MQAFDEHVSQVGTGNMTWLLCLGATLHTQARQPDPSKRSTRLMALGGNGQVEALACAL